MHQGRVPVMRLPDRQRAFPDEHREGFHRLPAREGVLPVEGATDDAGVLGRLQIGG